MSPDTVPFEAHIEILQSFLAQRDQIVEKIQGLLNAQGKPLHSLQDRPQLYRQFEDLFFTGTALRSEQIRLRGQLQQAHWARGFRPRVMPGIPNEMFDPADMTARAFSLWQHTRWPGRNGRVRYAHTLFNLYVVRCLTLLSMRLWDAGPGSAERLAQAQDVLDQLWKSSPADQPVLVRDVRWLVPVAQSPTTDELGPYFEAARQMADALPRDARLEIHKASVLMAGGHLRSQLRHYNMQGKSLDDHGLVLTTRGSNALDFAMTIQNLVPLLAAYEEACSAGGDRRLELAGAICQGVSPDPELFVNRLDLLGPYSMIEHLFITEEAGRAVLTPMGLRHVRLVQEYVTRMDRVSPLLLEDCPNFKPVPGTYSPYGVMFGFSSNLLEHMAMKTLQPDPVTRFGLEDVFADAEPSAEKLAWVSGWRKLPHIRPEVLKLYDYPQQFADALFDRVERALHRKAVSGGTVHAGRLFVSRDDPEATQLPLQFILSSDPQIVAAHQALFREEAELLHDRQEGMFLVSYRTPAGWTAISKDVLTEVLYAGHDARVSSLPEAAAQVLGLMCPALVASSSRGSAITP